MLYTCIREKFGSNAGLTNRYPELFRGVIQSLQANVETEPRLYQTVSFHILSNSSTILPLDDTV
jgi:hypothetical protein